jgi:hypothetical protein
VSTRSLSEEAIRTACAYPAPSNSFGLELHPEKTRLIEFGRYAAERRKKRGKGKPETFNFLGFSVLQKCTGKEVAWPNQSWTSCVIAGGGPPGIGLQEQVSNYLQAAAVKSRRW